MKITKPVLATLAIPDGKSEHIVWDDDLPGLGIRMRKGGSRVWIYQYRLGAKQRRVTIGHVGAIDPDKARKAAGELHAKTKLGSDPQAEKIAARTSADKTLGALVDAYLEEREADFNNGDLGRTSLRDMKRYLQKSWKPLHELGIEKITHRDLSMRLGKLKQETSANTANKCRVHLSGFYAWAIENGHAEHNPAAQTTRRKKASKHKNSNGNNRVLSPSEIVEVWNACRDDDYGRIVRLIILTLQRREEIAAVSWSEISSPHAFIDLPPKRTKNGLEHLVPLSQPAQAILETVPKRNDRDHLFGQHAGPFSGFSKAKRELDQRIQGARQKIDPSAKPMPKWTLHGLRHTGSTYMNESPPLGLGIQPHIVEAILNHISGFRGGVAGIYNKALYFEEKRAGLAQWAEYVTSLKGILPPHVFEHQYANVLRTTLKNKYKRKPSAECTSCS